MVCLVNGNYSINLKWNSATDIFPIDNKLQWPNNIPTGSGIYVIMWNDSLNYVGKSYNIDAEVYNYYDGMFKCCGDEPFETAELFWATCRGENKLLRIWSVFLLHLATLLITESEIRSALRSMFCIN